LVVSRRWKATFAEIGESMAVDRRLDWKWQLPDMPAELKALKPIEPSKPQTLSPQAVYTAAA
jgi:hypothetical protein